MALAAIASVFLLRYLGVVEFGRYIVVVSIVAVVGGITDVRLTIVGQREYAVANTRGERDRLLANLVGIRLAITPVGVLIGAASLSSRAMGPARYGRAARRRGPVFASLASTYTVPLTVDLRFGAVTAAELTRQLVIVIGIGALVAAGSALTPFFAVHIAAGAATLCVAVALVGLQRTPGPRADLAAWWQLIGEAARIALSAIVNVVYVRTLVIMTSLIATATETGLFVTSYRIVEVFLGVRPSWSVRRSRSWRARSHRSRAPRVRLAACRGSRVPGRARHRAAFVPRGRASRRIVRRRGVCGCG